jgi:hypothetical protein
MLEILLSDVRVTYTAPINNLLAAAHTIMCLSPFQLVLLFPNVKKTQRKYKRTYNELLM